MMGIADIHVHTKYSGFNRSLPIPYPESVTTPDEAVIAAAGKGLDLLCITDHNEVKGAQMARTYAIKHNLDIDVIVGEEITTTDGEILGLYLSEIVPPNLRAEETIDLIKSQGGLAIAPHPFSAQCPALGDKAFELDLNRIEVFNAGHRDAYSNTLALEKTIPSNYARLGGSDAHSAVQIAKGYTVFLGTTAEDLFKSIKNNRTKGFGKPIPLIEWVHWSMEVARGVFFQLILEDAQYMPEDDPHYRINTMRKQTKAMAAAGSLAFATPPVPMVMSLVSEGVARYKGRKMWKKQRSR